jgi:hypothetical protein
MGPSCVRYSRRHVISTQAPPSQFSCFMFWSEKTAHSIWRAGISLSLARPHKFKFKIQNNAKAVKLLKIIQKPLKAKLSVLLFVIENYAATRTSKWIEGCRGEVQMKCLHLYRSSPRLRTRWVFFLEAKGFWTKTTSILEWTQQDASATQ